MNQLFERFLSRDPFGALNLPAHFKGFDLTPRVDVSESEAAYDITVELPGIAEKDVTVTVDDGVLTISGEKRGEKDETKKNVHISERSYGTFQRAFRLPADADDQKIAATCDKGVLKVSIPRTKQPKNAGARQIEIKAS